MLPVFYINVAARTDRQSFMAAQFSELGIAAQRAEAVTPADLDPWWLSEASGPRGRGRVSPLELSCSMSHMKIWQQIVELGYPAAIVFEDDMWLSSLLPTLVATPLSELVSLDILRLETRGRPQLLGRRMTINGTCARQLLSPEPGTGGYLITSAGAKALLCHPVLAEWALDKALFGREGPCLYRMRVMQAVPAFCRPVMRDEEAAIAVSDISPDRRPRAFSRPPRTALLRLRRVRTNLLHVALSAANIVRLGAITSTTRQRVPLATSYK